MKPKENKIKQIDIKKNFIYFGRLNYIYLLCGLLFIVIGFLLMIGGGSKDPQIFNQEIFNFQRITLAPILLLIGYAFAIVSIMIKPKN